MSDNVAELLGYAEDEFKDALDAAERYERQMQQLALKRDFALSVAIGYDDYCRRLKAYEPASGSPFPIVPRLRDF